MSSVDHEQGKRREDRPAVRRRFVGRARTLQSDPEFSKTIEMIRGGWNEDYPEFALEKPKWRPDSLAANLLGACLPPKIEAAIRVAKARGEEVPKAVSLATSRWFDGILQLCELFWPPEWYPNWLGYPLHPAVTFVSACLVWNPKSLDPDELITYGNLRPRPLGYDPFDHWNTPGAAYWRTYANVLAEAIEEAIARSEPLTEEWRNNLKRDAATLSITVHNDHIATAQDELYWVFSPFPGLTGTDRDALMAEMLDALSLRHGVDPIRDEARALSSRGLNPNQISKLLGVDRKTVCGLAIGNVAALASTPGILGAFSRTQPRAQLLLCSVGVSTLSE